MDWKHRLFILKKDHIELYLTVFAPYYAKTAFSVFYKCTVWLFPFSWKASVFRSCNHIKLKVFYSPTVVKMWCRGTLPASLKKPSYKCALRAGSGTLDPCEMSVHPALHAQTLLLSRPREGLKRISMESFVSTLFSSLHHLWTCWGEDREWTFVWFVAFWLQRAP